MKTFSQFKVINESAQISAQEGALGIISTAKLEKYLEIADKFISDEAKKICKYMIEHEDWIKEMKKTSNNPILTLFNSTKPTDKGLLEIYKAVEKLNKADRLLEIPTFMTKEQFDGILKKTLSPDEVFLDFESEQGRNEIAKKYTPLVHKIARSWVGKTAFDYDQLVSYAYEGLIWALDSYGKKSNKQLKREESGMSDGIDMSKYKSYTFLSFASQMMRNRILDAAKNDSRLVRIPVSQQNRERAEQGFVAKSNSVSGDQPMGSKDGEGQTLFDIVGGIDNPGIKIDKEELDKLWDQVCKKLEEKFGPKTMDIFYNYFGFGNRKQVSGKEMAKKYGYKSPASITAEVVKVINFIKKDKTMFARFTDIYELMREHQEDLDELDTENDLYNVNGKIMEDANKEDMTEKDDEYFV